MGSDQANHLTLYNKHHKIKPISVLADPFWDQNYPSKKKLATFSLLSYPRDRPLSALETVPAKRT